MSLTVSVLFCSQFLVFNKNKIRFSDLLFGDAVRCFSGFPSERRASTTSVACTSSRILLKVFGFDRNLLQFSIIFCTIWQFLTHSNALPSLPPSYIRDLQIRLRVRVFQCVPCAHARLREAFTSTRSVVKISSPSWHQLRDFQQISSPDYEFTTGAKAS